MSYIFLFIINFITVVVIYLTSSSQLEASKKTRHVFTKSKWFYFLKNKKFYFIICCLVLVVMPIIQQKYLKQEAEEDQNKRDSIASITQDIRTLNLKRSYDTSTAAITSKSDSNHLKIIKALAENNLRYNIKQDKMEEIVKHYSAVSPTLICSLQNGSVGFESAKGDSSSFVYTFTSKGATSANINIYGDIAFTDDYTKTNEFRKINGTWWLKGDMIAENYFSSSTLNSSGRLADYIVIWCKGDYQNIDRNKTFVFNEVFLYSAKENFSTILSSEAKEKAINWFMSNYK